MAKHCNAQGCPIGSHDLNPTDYVFYCCRPDCRQRTLKQETRSKAGCCTGLTECQQGRYQVFDDVCETSDLALNI